MKDPHIVEVPLSLLHELRGLLVWGRERDLEEARSIIDGLLVIVQVQHGMGWRRPGSPPKIPPPNPALRQKR